MLDAEKRWQLYPQHPDLCSKLGVQLGVTPIVAQVLLNRGILSIRDAKEFLFSESFSGTFLEEECEKTACLIEACLANRSKILVYGDYDVDGMTSVSIMVSFLRELGATVDYVIPSRFLEGYGLHTSVIDRMNADSVGMLMTLDCGVSNVSEITEIKEKTTAYVVVMDHHTIPPQLPPCDVMVNPKFLDSLHDCYGLCTAGIVYCFVSYYAQSRGLTISLEKYLDLAALGTVADVAPLVGANRTITRLGLSVLSSRIRPGIRAILSSANCDRSELTTRDIGFVIAPRLNASGRLAHAGLGVALLLSQTDEEAQMYASRLEKLNLDRRAIDQDILNESLKKVELEGADAHKVIVLSGLGWHSGVIGITASKLVERLGRPVVIISENDGVARGSARTVGTVNIYELLRQCSEHFLHFGGHKEAAGFSLEPWQIDPFKRAIVEFSNAGIEPESLRPVLSVDGTLNPQDISEDLVKDIERLEPFGQGNSQPLFFSDQFEVVDTRLVGDGKHVKATLTNRKQRVVIDAIGFNLGAKFSYFQKGGVSILFHVGLNSWQGRVKPQLQLVDVKCLT